jgi:hypothetical protein
MASRRAASPVPGSPAKRVTRTSSANTLSRVVHPDDSSALPASTIERVKALAQTIPPADVANVKDLNTTTRVLPSWTVMRAIRELLANALDQDRNGASADFTDASSGGRGALVIKNKSATGLTIEKFKYDRSEAARAETSTGQHGYGLKDSVCVLARHGVCYYATTRTSRFEIVVDGSDVYVLEAPAVVDPSSKAELVTTTLTGVSKADFDAAKWEIVHFRVRSKNLELIEESLRGAVYRSTDTDVGSAIAVEAREGGEVFIRGLRYACKRHTILTYDIYMDRDKLNSRDRFELPAHWDVALESLVTHCSPKVMLSFEQPFLEAAATGVEKSPFWELRHKPVREALVRLMKIRESELEDRKADLEQKRREQASAAEAMKVLESRLSSARSQYLQPSTGAAPAPAARAPDVQAQHRANLLVAQMSEMRDIDAKRSSDIARLDALPAPKRIVYAQDAVDAQALTALLGPNVIVIPAKRQDVQALKDQGLLSLEQVHLHNRASLLDNTYQEIPEQLTGVCHYLKIDWQFRFRPLTDTTKPATGTPHLAWAEAASHTIWLETAGSPDAKKLARAALAELARATTDGSLTAQYAYMVNLLVQTLDVLPKPRVDVLHVAAPTPEPERPRPWCPLVVVPMWSAPNDPYVPLAALMRAVVEAMLAIAETVYIMAMQDHMPDAATVHHRMRVVHPIRRAGQVLPDLAELDLRRVSTVIGFDNATMACAAALCDRQEFSHCQLWQFCPTVPSLRDRVLNEVGVQQSPYFLHTDAATTQRMRATSTVRFDADADVGILGNHITFALAPLKWWRDVDVKQSRPDTSRPTVVVAVDVATSDDDLDELVCVVHTWSKTLGNLPGRRRGKDEQPATTVKLIVTGSGDVDALQARFQSGLGAKKSDMQAILHYPCTDVLAEISRAYACFVVTRYLPLWTLLAAGLQAGVRVIVRNDCSLLDRLHSTVHIEPIPETPAVQLTSPVGLNGARAALNEISSAFARRLLALSVETVPPADGAGAVCRTLVVAETKLDSIQLNVPTKWTWKHERFDVFISFRGGDSVGVASGGATMRTAIVAPLWGKLEGAKYSTFFDQNALAEADVLHAGTRIADILQGMLCSRGNGVVLVLMTPTFLDRLWPRIELACLTWLHEQGQIHLKVVCCFGMTVDMVTAHPFVCQVCPALHNFPMDSLDERTLSADDVVEVLARKVKEAMVLEGPARGRFRPESFRNLRSFLADRIEPHHQTAARLALLLLGAPLRRDDVTINMFDPARSAKIVEDDMEPLRKELVMLAEGGGAPPAVNEMICMVDAYITKWLRPALHDGIPQELLDIFTKACQYR